MLNERSAAFPAPAPVFHHVGVQTNDLANSVAWYSEFFGARESWSLEAFSRLTLSRLPGIRRLVELAVGDSVRVHLFERPGDEARAPAESVTAFQHLCMAVGQPGELEVLRARWIELFESGRFHYALDEQPTPVVVDDDGVRSFYAYDVNGLEYEFTYAPRVA